MRKYGFTLVEILVVLAILAILSGLLFPVFARTRSKARQASCLSNLKQIGSAINLYSIDHDGKLPWVAALGRYQTVTNPSEALYGPPYYFLPDLVDRYLKNKPVWLCPEVSWQEPIRPGQITFLQNDGSYSFNYKTPPRFSQVNGKPTIVISGNQLENFPDVARISMIWDTRHWGAGSGVVVQPPHNGGLNVLFADGHVKWRSIQAQLGSPMVNNYWRDLSWEGFQ